MVISQEVWEWAEVKRKQQKADQAAGRFHTYFPETSAPLQNLFLALGVAALMKNSSKETQRAMIPGHEQDATGISALKSVRLARQFSAAFGHIKPHYMTIQQPFQAQRERKQNKTDDYGWPGILSAKERGRSAFFWIRFWLMMPSPPSPVSICG